MYEEYLNQQTAMKHTDISDIREDSKHRAQLLNSRSRQDTCYGWISRRRANGISGAQICYSSSLLLPSSPH